MTDEHASDWHRAAAITNPEVRTQCEVLNGSLDQRLSARRPVHIDRLSALLILSRDKKEQAVTREQAMAVLTSAGAFAEFAEKDKGRLMPGMFADFAVLSQDVFQVPEEQIPATRSMLTVVGGKIAYRADGF